MKEVWKDIIGYEGLYQISSFGNVKSLERRIIKGSTIQIRKERIMSKRESSDGYYIAKLNVNKVSKSFPIHRLVALHFIPNPNNLPEVNHKDFNRKNNKVSNLEWVTHEDNVLYSRKFGRYGSQKGENNPNYGNHILHNKYTLNPDLSQKCQARPHGQNGKAQKVEIYDSQMNYIKTFDWIGDCCMFLKNQGLIKCKANSARNKVSSAIKSGKLYCNYYFKKPANTLYDNTVPSIDGNVDEGVTTKTYLP